MKAKADAEVAASVAKAEVAASKARAERERAKALARELAETKNEGGVLPRATEKDAEGDADSALRAAATQVVSGAALAAKTCFICGEDCSARPRQRDDAGRYACLACVQRKLKEREGKKAKSAAAAAAAIPAAQGRAARVDGSPGVKDGRASSAAAKKQEEPNASSRDGPATVLASVIAEAEANSRKSGAGDTTYRAPSAPIRPPVTQRTGTVNPAASLVDTAFFQNLAKGVRGGGDDEGDLDTPRGEKEKRPNAFGVPNTPRVAVSSAPSSPNRASPARSVGDPSPAHLYPRSTQNTPAEKSRGTSRIAPLRPPNFPRPPPRRAGVRDETSLEPDIAGNDLAAFWRRAMDKGTTRDQERVVSAVRAHFKLADAEEKLLGVFECCKGETPDHSGDMFVFSNHVCFRKDAVASLSYSGSKSGVVLPPGPSKFAVPMRQILDASINPGVYPFGAIAVTIDGLAKPWIFSFFTEREAAVKCIRSARGYVGGGEEAIAAWRARNGARENGARKEGGAKSGGFLRWLKGRGGVKNAAGEDAATSRETNRGAAQPSPGGAFGSRVNSPRADEPGGGPGGVPGVILGVGGLVLAVFAGGKSDFGGKTRGAAKAAAKSADVPFVKVPFPGARGGAAPTPPPDLKKKAEEAKRKAERDLKKKAEEAKRKAESAKRAEDAKKRAVDAARRAERRKKAEAAKKAERQKKNT